MPEPYYPFRLTPEERADGVAIVQRDPVRAGELEFASWREPMLWDRDCRCPDGRLHDTDPCAPSAPYNVRNPSPLGYYGLCRRCGHYSAMPF